MVFIPMVLKCDTRSDQCGMHSGPVYTTFEPHDQGGGQACLGVPGKGGFHIFSLNMTL